jgi:radical SAM protein with 4Fe4S-binding SPASM domain
LPKALLVAELSFENPLADQCCGMGTSHMVIRHDGNLAACPMTVNDHSFVPVEDLLVTMRSTFTTHPSERGGEDECLSCQWYKVCGSACPESNKRYSGHYFTKSPLCEFWKFVIPRYLDFYGVKMQQAIARLNEVKGGSYASVN